MTRRGTNQFKQKNHFVKPKVMRDAWIVLNFVLVISLAIVIGRTEEAKKHVKFESPIPQVYAVNEFAIEPSQPPMAELPEREANIRIIKKIWGRDWRTGVAIAKCESGLRSNAFNGRNTNGTWDAGLFQINTIHGWEKEQLFNPVANTGIAYAKFVEQGTNPWYSSKHCWESEVK